jgi:hypothetical protein
MTDIKNTTLLLQQLIDEGANNNELLPIAQQIVEDLAEGDETKQFIQDA